jgi:hypothetical protein
VAARITAIVIRDVCQIVVVIDMTGRAGRRGVRAIENKTGAAVIKSSRAPTVRVVAIQAIRSGEGRTGCGVNWVIGLLPILEVAGGVATVA